MAYVSAILIWLVGALVGSMLFFAFTVVPAVFRALSAEQAGLFLRAFFPNYYLWGLIVALIAAALAIAANATVSVACFLVALLFVFARQTLTPKINHAREEEILGIPGAGNRFKTLHLWSVLINGFQMVVLLAAAGLLLRSQ
jgi:hypothetical protein